MNIASASICPGVEVSECELSLVHKLERAHRAQWHPLDSCSPPTLTAFVRRGITILAFCSVLPRCKSRVSLQLRLSCQWRQLRLGSLSRMTKSYLPALKHSFRSTHIWLALITICRHLGEPEVLSSYVRNRDQPDKLKRSHQAQRSLPIASQSLWIVPV